ncbi:MvaI/BcnI family restriction endonuclease [Methermicoccus shengliensis]|uniref:MvaI/BcnI restriction endonuclease domain-containing protein n=1 Tax=Methermicoccus shengliensis TaxID=660064 RepID=A0A832VZC9_9EURY|nr:MvaI/BcnI family restriction endonuclease [Methermicoccus shengliensis]KUK05024.1 MAG: hypothetical protein XD46_0017 [Euryarchaeota archaeon 55_53]KUK30234.1 MAG: hypothetical protein XD62_0673 [Methanosarcinales archeaon 56_1174]MDI3487592.1 hypothetical protein [Methanosarcinales archaeon]MDN5294741.1 hypothetical protein [Methanosarcinales archaeon]HIH69454.1 hypothetical protein [Methermicoccus shengliensis]
MASEIRSLEDLKRRLLEIKELGWIPSRRSRDTGIGKTFEDLLGIPENNLQLPDVGGIEVKSSREYTQSMITLITFEPPKEWRNVNWTLDDLVATFGETGFENGGPVFHITVYATHYTSNAQQFKLEVREINGTEMVCAVTRREFVGINQNLPRDVVVAYLVDEIVQRISKKLKGCLLIIEAESRTVDDREEFKLKSAKLYTGFSEKRFIELVQEGQIALDIRFGRYKDGKPHNHGTGWRIKKKDVLKLYAREIDLLNDDIPNDINCDNPIIIEDKDTREKDRKITDFISILLLLL